jgi:IgA Peptidase M64.
VAGNPARPIDTTNRGKYFFEVTDAATGTVQYSRGFSSIYGEWETTAEARDVNRTFSESLRFPLPDRPVRIVVKKRDARNVFREIWSTKIDPADKFVVHGAEGDAGPIIKLHESGDPARKLDLLILGDGYTARERTKFERDARRLTATLLATSPFKERQNEINVWGLSPAAAQSGISRHRSASIAAPPSAPRTTPSIPSATCSPSRTRRSAIWRRTHPTKSSRS